MCCDTLHIRQFLLSSVNQMDKLDTSAPLMDHLNLKHTQEHLLNILRHFFPHIDFQ